MDVATEQKRLRVIHRRRAGIGALFALFAHRDGVQAAVQFGERDFKVLGCSLIDRPLTAVRCLGGSTGDINQIIGIGGAHDCASSFGVIHSGTASREGRSGI